MVHNEGVGGGGGLGGGLGGALGGALGGLGEVPLMGGIGGGLGEVSLGGGRELYSPSPPPPQQEVCRKYMRGDCTRRNCPYLHPI